MTDFPNIHDTGHTLTARQREVLDFIESYYAEHRIAPHIREIAAGLQMSAGPAYQLIVKLTKKGYIGYSGPRRHRSIDLLGRRLRDVPTGELIAELIRRGGVHG